MRRVDAIIVGGGIAGASMATVLASSGLKVVVLEKTAVFKDENRGEVMWPWGVREAIATGLLDVFVEAGGNVVGRNLGYSDLDLGHEDITDLSALIDDVPGSMNLAHPTARQALLDAARAAGADVIRGVKEVTATGGDDPRVAWAANGANDETRCRLIIGADGRRSKVRQQAGVELFEGGAEFYAAGMLVRGDAIPSDANVVARERATLFLSFPQRDGFARLYQCFPVDERKRFAGPDRAEAFIQACALETLPGSRRWTDAQPAGPCATFPCSDTWVGTPVVEGIALIGDAAGYNNFLIGQGLSMALRDVAVLSGLLLGSENWSPGALSGYQEERTARLNEARYLAHLSGWRNRGFRDAPEERTLAARLATEDDLIPQFRGDIFTGYGDETRVSIDALWERLDRLDRRIETEVPQA